MKIQSYKKVTFLIQLKDYSLLGLIAKQTAISCFQIVF